MSINIFKRYETKYIITTEQYNKINLFLKNYTIDDEYGKNTICNIYFDTPNNYLIRRSIEKPIYKEKLRIRSYGLNDNPTNVFIELKKKYKGVVYKRRTKINYLLNKNIFNKLNTNTLIKNENTNNQIFNEICYFINYYKDIKPKIFISYDRKALIAKDDNNLRITFDNNILYRTYDLFFTSKAYGDKILDDNQIIMEIKSANNYPLWLVNFLSKEKIYKTSFSKYGKAYKRIVEEKHEF